VAVQGTLSARDLSRLRAITSDRRTDLTTAGLPLSLLRDLLDVIPADYVTFYGSDHKPRTPAWFLQQTSPDNADEEAYWTHYRNCPPCCYPQHGGNLREVIRFSDFYSAREWRSAPIYCDYYRAANVEHALKLFLPAPGWAPADGTLQLVLWRGPGPDFSERDRVLLALLRPHLHEAYLDAERGRRKTPELTPRQWDLLHLLAAGHTNAQIARRLNLSQGTVRKHLENIYNKLQVSNRTTAVTCAFPQGSSDRLTMAAPEGSACPE
jgi:DNA-binding CsgD family transcriptional regulator